MAKVPETQRVVDWESVYQKVRTGLMSKGEICRIYGIKRQKLEEQLAKNGITADLHTATIDNIKAKMAMSMMTDETIISSTSERAVAVVKSHLTLTRSLGARLQELIQKYDEAANLLAQQVDQGGEAVIDIKLTFALSNLLDQITKTAERLTRMELNTFGVTPGKNGNPLLDPPPSIRPIETDDAAEASRAYMQIMQSR